MPVRFFLCAVLFNAAGYTLLPTLPLILHQRGATPAEVGAAMGAFTAAALLFRAPVASLLTRRAPEPLLRWGQAAMGLGFLAYLPFSKHFHVYTSLPNVLLRPLEEPGRLVKMDLENMEDGGHVVPGSDFGDHSAVRRVNVFLTGHDRGDDAGPILHDGGGGLVAGALEPEHSHFRDSMAASASILPLSRRLSCCENISACCRYSFR